MARKSDLGIDLLPYFGRVSTALYNNNQHTRDICLLHDAMLKMPCRHQSHASPDPIARRAFTISLHSHILHLQITGMLENTGHSVLFRIDTNSSQAYDDSRLAINITGGPLSYRYRFDEMHIHYGLHDSYGSEHSVQGYTFPAEVSC